MSTSSNFHSLPAETRQKIRDFHALCAKVATDLQDLNEIGVQVSFQITKAATDQPQVLSTFVATLPFGPEDFASA